MKKILLIFSVLLLVSLLLPLTGASATKSLVIDVAADSYIVTDLNDPDDTLGFAAKNYGDLDFVKAWYLWNVVEEEVPPEEQVEEEQTEEEQTEEEQPPEEPETVEVEKEKIISVIYLKFDLSEIEEKEIESAMLQLYANNVVLLAPRYLQVFLVDSEWEETTLNFNNRPLWGQNAVSVATMYNADIWYGFDVTDSVKGEKESGQISFAAMLPAMEKASEELVAFPSREAGENAARILITYTETGFTFAWYWWVVIGVVVLALVAAAFFGGLRLRRTKPAPAKEAATRKTAAKKAAK